MTISLVGVAALLGGVVGLGVFLLVGGLVPATPGLRASLDRLSGDPAEEVDRVRLAPDAPRSERLGAWLQARTPIPLTAGQRRMLELRGKPVAEFYADKAVLTVLGAAIPGILASVWTSLFGGSPLVPAGLVLLGAAVGWFVPDLQLRGADRVARTDAGDALFTFFDLVTLERLANLSGTQALHSAAGLSDAQLFRQIRAALERARLEQQPPYAELKRLGGRLRLPELVDVADVMAMDETGAALSTALRARVRELRDAHLTAERIAANAVSERMTLFMVIPTMVFGLLFLTPPLLRLVFG